MSNSFDEFQLNEYNNISEAHFKTIEAISSFFKYYLTIIALPITLFSLYFEIDRSIPQNNDFDMAIRLLSFSISIIGFLMLLYIINLKLDSILYARTVNSIRKYFYDSSNGHVEDKIKIRVLPQNSSQPPYYEVRYFIPVVTSFAFFNMMYGYVVLFFFKSPIALINGLIDGSIPLISYETWRIGILLVYFIAHFAAYKIKSDYREYAYLQSNSIGVDIDGVLNKHREQFCELIEADLDSSQITTIPIHENPSLEITKEMANAVFNNTKYWTEMPVLEDSSETLRKLKNSYDMRIDIFTHRPWPIVHNLMDDFESEWKADAIEYIRTSFMERHGCWWQEIYCYLLLGFIKLRFLPIPYIKTNPVNEITKTWLNNNNFIYDSLIVERSSEDVARKSSKFRNRFHYSRNNKYRYFVEDDPIKATKLAYLCDIVFLIKHPYNEYQIYPDNVIKVNSWGEIYQCIKKM